MKVCTDACILGAWFAEKIRGHSSILDVGSGTGLLMMMMAQKTKATIHGIEIDLSSFRQSKQNIHCNKWKDRLIVFPGDARNYVYPIKYDFIISNPPFYEKDLESITEPKQLAKHSKGLLLPELIQIAKQHLKPDGSFGIMLPYHRKNEFIESARQQHFFPAEQLFIRQTPAHDFFRAVIHFHQKEIDTAVFELTIHGEDRNYTPEFIELMKDYYLNL